MQLLVDPIQRHAKTRAHTATHLLHAQLAAIFPQTKQAGSLVDEDYLRFDFYADTALTDQQIQDIETQINTQIAQALPVDTQELSYDAAIQAGAKAFFEDKYGDTVRVVTVGDKLSVELCGGTHTANTAHIGAFVITSQEAVASGVKRITAVTGPKVSEELNKKSQELKNIAKLLGVQEKQIVDKIQSIQGEKQELENQKSSLEKSVILGSLTNITQQKDGYTIVDTRSIPALASVSFKSLVQSIKESNTGEYIIIEATGSFAIISPSSQAKSFAQSHNLKGGGSDQLFQGKDPTILTLIAAG